MNPYLSYPTTALAALAGYFVAALADQAIQGTGVSGASAALSAVLTPASAGPVATAAILNSLLPFPAALVLSGAAGAGFYFGAKALGTLNSVNRVTGALGGGISDNTTSYSTGDNNA
jgi:hypothetical protein